MTPSGEPDKIFRTADIVGCAVVTEAGEILGTLKDVLPSGSNDVWVVEGRREYMIPALKEVILDVDAAAKRIRVRLPEGLRDVYEA